MVLAFLLSRINRFGLARRRFVWTPALDLRNSAVYSTLLPGTQY